MKEKVNRFEFQKVIEATNIREIVLISTNCKCPAHFLIKPKNTMLSVKRKVDTKFSINRQKTGGLIFSIVDFTIEGISQQDTKTIDKKNDPLFTISASYRVTYEVSDINLNKATVEYFGKENAYFNVYPYLREFITHISQRFNLHPVVIPLLKPTKQPRQSKQNKKKAER